MPYIAMLKNPSKNSQIRTRMRTISNIYIVICCYTVFKEIWYFFHGDPISNFYAKLLTDRETERKTNSG